MLDYTISSGNIFQDLGFYNAEEKMTKVKLAAVIAQVLEQQQINHIEAGQILGLELEQMNNLSNGILKDFTIDELLIFIIKLGKRIEIMVTDQPLQKLDGNINVVYHQVA